MHFFLGPLRVNKKFLKNKFYKTLHKLTSSCMTKVTRSRSRWRIIANTHTFKIWAMTLFEDSVNISCKLFTHHSLQFDMPHYHVRKSLIFDPFPGPWGRVKKYAAACNSHTKFGWISSNGLGGDSITDRLTHGWRQSQYPPDTF